MWTNQTGSITCANRRPAEKESHLALRHKFPESPGPDLGKSPRCTFLARHTKNTENSAIFFWFSLTPPIFLVFSK